MGSAIQWGGAIAAMWFGAASAQGVGVLAPDVLFERLAPSVWAVDVHDGQGKPLPSGSAVVVGPGSLVTNCHVLAKSSRVSVSRDNMSYGATLEHADAERDLCLLKVRNLHAPAVTVGNTKEVKIGSRVYAVGSPSGQGQTISDGLLSGVRKSADGEVTALQITVPMSPGSSGGGLFDGRGRLIGITAFQARDAQSPNFAAPASWIAQVPQRAQTQPSLPAAASGPVAGAAVAPMGGSSGSSEVKPAPSPASAAAAAAGVTVFEYHLRERLTGITKRVVYKLDRVEDELRYFNQGTRVEKDGGEVTSIGTVIAGEFEQGMPPGGWYRGQSGPSSWKLRYTNSFGGATVKMNLQAEEVGEDILQVAGRELRTKRVQFRGYTTRGSSPTSPTAHYAASVWYSPELGRVVRFEVKSRSSGAIFIEETLELVTMR